MTKKNLIKTDSLFEYSKAAADKLSKAFAKINLKEITDNDSGTFRVIMTSDKKDRDGEIIKLDGWYLENFMKNPILIYGHNYYSIENVIGRVDKIYREGNTLVAEGRFASEKANPKAQMVRRLYDEKILQAVSVGFIVKGRDPADDSIITSAELLELSFVPIQSNPDAVNLLKSIKELEGMEHKDSPDGEDEGGEDTTTDDPEVKELLVNLAKSIEGLTGEIKSGFASLQVKATNDAEEKLFELKEATQTAARSFSEALRNLKK